MSEEKDRIRREAVKLVFGPDGRPTGDPGRVERVLPSEQPRWDYNLDRGREHLLTFASCS